MRQMYAVRLMRENRQRRVARRRNFRGCKESRSQGKKDILWGGPRVGIWRLPIA
jgi:hypothetical protein